MWKPIREYPTDPLNAGPVVLARDKQKMPVLVRLVDGHFVICPAVWLFYGKSQLGVTYADHVTEFMEIPE